MATKSFNGSTVNRIAWSAGLHSLADQYGAFIAIRDGQDRTLTYLALRVQAHELARVLIDICQVQGGQPVGTLLPNQVCAVVASYGVRASGAAEVPISFKSTEDEIQWCAELSKVRHVVTLPEKAELIRSLGLEPVIVDSAGHCVESQHAHGQSHTEVLKPVDADLPGRILFTSGTTGKPKGVLYTHGRRWIAEQMLKASLPLRPSTNQKIILMTPFIHGSSLLTYAWCDYGAEVILLEGVEQALLERYLVDPSVVAVFAPPTVLAKITAMFEGRCFTHIQCIFTGTQPLTQTMYGRAKAMFGPIVRITYGKSECVNPITVLTAAQTQAYFESSADLRGACVGYAAPGVELKIVASRQGDERNDTGEGEVWLKAPHMSLGMLNGDGFVPHEPDGWHQTGDLGYIDACGRLVLTGRLADVIKTGGYRVNPDEIEASLAALQCPIEMCVTSLPSDYWGEIIIAVGLPGFNAWQEQAKCLVSKLSRHKQPRAYVELEKLPRNPQGKISRRLVRQQVLLSYDLIDGPYPKLEPKGQSA